MNRTALRAFLTIAVALAARPALAQTNPYTWQVGTGTWNTAANWQNGAGAAEVPPSTAATQLAFPASGTTSYTATNNIGTGTFTLNRLTVNNTGTGTVTIAGAAAANSLTFAGTDPTLDVTGEALLTAPLTGTASVVKTGPGTLTQRSNSNTFTGTLTVNEGTFVSAALTSGTFNFNPVSIVVNSGGTYQFGLNTTGNPNLPNTTYITANSGGTVVWQEGEDFGGFNLLGGTLDFQQGGANTNGTAPQSWTSGTITGGPFTVGGTGAVNKTTAGTVTVAGLTSIDGTGLVSVQEGTLLLSTAANLGVAPFALGQATAGGTQGTLRYDGATATRNGNLTTNLAGGTVAVTAAATTLTLNGTLAGDGVLTKAGPGTLALTGTLNQTGVVTASEGTVQVSPGTSAGGFAALAGATFAVNSGDGGATFTAPTLSLAGGTARFDLNAAALPAAPLLTVGNPDGLTSTGTPVLRLTNAQPFVNGTYTLIDYNGTPITGGYTLQLPGRTAGTLGYDTANTTITATITGTDSVRWTGAVSNVWDAGTAPGVGGTNNWRLVVAVTPTNFIDTDTTFFDDSSAVTSVALPAAVQPASVTVNAAADYTFAGAGRVTGPGSLTKAGTGALVLATDNDYSGGTTVTGGTLQLGNGGTSGGVTAGLLLNGGNLAFNRSAAATLNFALAANAAATVTQNGTGDVTVTGPVTFGANTLTLDGPGNLTFGAALTGTNAIVKNGPGTATLLGNSNPFTGTLTINGGTVALNDLGGGGDFGATLITANPGGKFVFGGNGDPDLPNATFIDVNGGELEMRTGEQFGGVRLGAGVLRLTNAGLTAVGSGGPFTGIVLESGAVTATGTAAILNGNATNPVTKRTAATVTISGTVAYASAAPFNIEEGVISFEAANVPAVGTAELSIGVTGPSTFRLTGPAPASVARPVTLGEAGSTFDVTDAAGSLAFTNVVSGVGGVTKTGPGVLTLGGANTYAGATAVGGGRLNVTGNSAGATGPVTVAAGAALGGTGTVGGAVTADGTVRGGVAGVGTLTLANGLTVNGGGRLLVELVDGSTPAAAGTGGSTVGPLPNPTSNSFLNVTGGTSAINPGATIEVLVSGGTFAEGVSYSFRVGGGFGDQSGLSITNPAQFQFVNLAVSAASLTGDASGAVFLNFTPVPEPATALGLAALALTAVRLRRR